jgi:hypothetical protein
LKSFFSNYPTHSSLFGETHQINGVDWATQTIGIDKDMNVDYAVQFRLSAGGELRKPDMI